MDISTRFLLQQVGLIMINIMETEILMFTLTVIAVTLGTVIASWQDKCITDEIKKYRFRNETVIMNPIKPSYAWKTWGNIYALFVIFAIISVQVVLGRWTYMFMWYPIMWLLWWTVHDLTTGWFILKKPLHISSDPISQYFGAVFLQSGFLMLVWRLFWLTLLTLIYLNL